MKVFSKNKCFNGVDSGVLADFADFHLKNPKIFLKFKEYSNEMMKSGIKKYSAWPIIGRIRYEYDLANAKNKTNKRFKINNNYIALYSRLLISYDKKFDVFFELRSMKPKNVRAK